MNEMVEITEEEYKRLKASEALLEKLQSYGVDNWMPYEHAVADWEAEGYSY